MKSQEPCSTTERIGESWVLWGGGSASPRTHLSSGWGQGVNPEGRKNPKNSVFTLQNHSGFPREQKEAWRIWLSQKSWRMEKVFFPIIAFVVAYDIFSLRTSALPFHTPSTGLLWLNRELCASHEAGLMLERGAGCGSGFGEPADLIHPRQNEVTAGVTHCWIIKCLLHLNCMEPACHSFSALFWDVAFKCQCTRKEGELLGWLRSLFVPVFKGRDSSGSQWRRKTTEHINWDTLISWGRKLTEEEKEILSWSGIEYFWSRHNWCELLVWLFHTTHDNDVTIWETFSQ